MIFATSAFGANPTNKASIRVGEITLPTGTYGGVKISTTNLGYLRADFSITPLRLSPQDGKGLDFTDLNGNRVLFALDNAAPFQFASYVAISNLQDQVTYNTSLAVGTTYDFSLVIGPTTATLWWKTRTGNIKIGTISHSLTPPFDMGVGVQRSGATFSDIIVKER
jgi:hypothetical protein